MLELVAEEEGTEVWEWRDSDQTWTNRTPSPLPDGWMPPLAERASAYHGTRHSLMVYGGYPLNGPPLNDALIGHDLWEWDATAGKWNDLTPAPLTRDWPEVAVVSRQMVYDTRLDALVLFGGVRSNSTFSDDMYLWK